MRRRAAGVLALALLALAAWTASSGAAGLPPGGLAPQPTGSLGSVQWTPVGVESAYKVAISTAPRANGDRSTVYLTLPRRPGERQYYLPKAPPGQGALYVGVSADDGTTWSNGEAALGAGAPGGEAAPEAEGLATGEEPAEASAEEAPSPLPDAEAGNAAAPAGSSLAQGPIIGTNDGSGWGPQAAQTILAGHISWNRVELGAASNTLAASLRDGFKVLAIVNNPNDGTPLSQIDAKRWGAGVVSELQANPGITIAEAANEAYLKGGVANPAQYGRMYLAAINAMKAASIPIPLLFDMTGDYPRGSWSSPLGWSQDAAGGGWLRDAVSAVPGLAAAIRANGIAIHPYGALGENKHDDYGVSAAAADESVARTVLGSIPPFYITEFGYDLARCGRDLGACSRTEQASKLRAAYSVFLADPHVAGIWWYQSHDDSTGRWGFMNRNNTTRPAFRSLSAIAVAAGQ
jgi:hypothetical protein